MHMKYSEGAIGRVIVARFDDGEEMVSGMRELMTRTGISSAVVFFLGALRSGETVVGPVEDELPPVPSWLAFGSPHEVVGVGTVFPVEGKPAIHLHGAVGRGDRSFVGCLRKVAEVYLILEVIVLEILGSAAVRVSDPRAEMFLLDPEPRVVRENDV